jgi:hypothetical protein
MTPEPKRKRVSAPQFRRLLVGVLRDRATLLDRLLLAQALGPPRARKGAGRGSRRPGRR